MDMYIEVAPLPLLLMLWRTMEHLVILVVLILVVALSFRQ